MEFLESLDSASFKLYWAYQQLADDSSANANLIKRELAYMIRRVDDWKEQYDGERYCSYLIENSEKYDDSDGIFG